MFRNYLKIAFRSFSAHKVYYSINILGLGVGIACALLIFLYVYDEYSFDKFHEGSERIYRVEREIEQQDGGKLLSISVPGRLIPKLKNEFDDIESITGFYWSQTYHFFEHEEKRFAEQNFYYADSSFFDVFSFRFIHGDPSTALDRPGSAVITESTARKYFGNKNPIGSSFTRASNDVYTVTGIIEDVPVQSHFDFDFILGFSERIQTLSDDFSKYTYLRLSDSDGSKYLDDQLALLAKEAPEGDPLKANFHLRPLTDIYLHSNSPFELSENGDIRYIYIFSAIAMLILFLGGINFINLSTAIYSRRMREIGMRKVLGAHGSQIFRQFICESTVTTLFSIVLGVTFLEMALPIFNEVSGKQITSVFYNNNVFWLFCIILLTTIAFIAGSVPGIVFSSLKPVNILKGRKVFSASSNGGMRNVLVIVQFSVSIALIIGATIVSRQLNYIQEKDLGFDADNLIALRGGWAFQNDQRYNTFREELTRKHDITGVARLSFIPGDELFIGTVAPQGERASLNATSIAASANFTQILGADLLAGRTFLEGSDADKFNSAIINETFARQMGWENEEAVGMQVDVRRQLGRSESAGDTLSTLTIIGVINDIHFSSLHESIQPVIFTQPLHYWAAYNVIVRIQDEAPENSLATISDVWTEFLPSRHFEYFYVSEKLAVIYDPETKLGDIGSIFAALGIFIACTGLFALSAFSMELRIKEIGIRKVLGASFNQVLILVNNEFVRLVVISFVIASPIILLILEKWLQGFAYRIDMPWFLFLVSGILTLMVALVTISFQTIRAAQMNPIDIIKNE